MSTVGSLGSGDPLLLLQAGPGPNTWNWPLDVKAATFLSPHLK